MNGAGGQSTPIAVAEGLVVQGWGYSLFAWEAATGIQRWVVPSPLVWPPHRPWLFPSAAVASGFVVGLVARPIRRHVTTRMQSRSNGALMDRDGTAKVRNLGRAAEPTVDTDTTTSFGDRLAYGVVDEPKAIA